MQYLFQINWFIYYL